MKRPESDRAYLRQGLMLPASLAAAGLAALLLTAWALGGIGSALARDEQQLAGLDQQRTELAARLQARSDFAGRFHQLQAAGVIGDGQRLAWAQQMRDSATVLGLPYLRYVAAAEQPFTAPWLPGESGLPVTVTTVELQAGLVHELDLLRLLARLRAAPGWLDVAGCTLERAEKEAAVAPERANLAASCRVRWFAIPLQPGPLVAEAGP